MCDRRIGVMMDVSEVAQSDRMCYGRMTMCDGRIGVMMDVSEVAQSE